MLFWVAFLARGAIQVLFTPVWEGFDEPFHVAYAAFFAEHGRPPGFAEPSFPSFYYRVLPLLPSRVGNGAPGYSEWRRLAPAERARRRAAVETARPDASERRSYAHANYERQQPPLFYALASPIAGLFARGPLPDLVLALRLYCLLIASLVVPATAVLARLLLPRRGVFFALPVVAFLPNTAFYVDHVTNDALAWPVLAGVAATLVLVWRRPSVRRAALLGALSVCAAWTKLTLLIVVACAAITVVAAARRQDARRRALSILLGAVLPLAATAVLLSRTRAETGSWTGIIYSIRTPGVGARELLSELPRIDYASALRQWFRSHVWSGGWSFVALPRAAYRAAGLGLAAGALALLAALQKPGRVPGAARWPPLLLVAVLFFAAMVFHLVSASAAARALSTGPLAGGEGWYFDVLRPLEAAAAAALLCALVPRPGTLPAAALLATFLLAADAAATLGVLLPYWGGGRAGQAAALSDLPAHLRNAHDAAPLVFSLFLPAALAAVVVAAAGAGVALSSPRFTSAERSA